MLLHSGGSSGAQWTKIAETLAHAHRSIAPDFLGFGGTQPWPEPGALTHDLQADLVADVIAAEGGGPLDVVGHSTAAASPSAWSCDGPNSCARWC